MEMKVAHESKDYQTELFIIALWNKYFTILNLFLSQLMFIFACVD